MLSEDSKPQWKVGDRVRLVRMVDDRDPIAVGQRGSVTCIHPHSDWTQVDVDWDNGRSLMPSIPPDEIVLEMEAQP